MSFAWHEIREQLMQSSSTFGFQRSFVAIREANTSTLQRFSDPVSVLEYLHHGEDAPERKNDLLAVLIAAAQSSGSTASCAQTMVLLALWPGLDAVRKRLVWCWKLAPDEATAEVMSLTCTAIARMDLRRVNRIAATLLRNVERDIGRSLRREADRQKEHSPIDTDDLPLTAAILDPLDGEAHLAREVEALIGRDAPLVLSVAWEGLTQAEAGSAMGLSETAARKRFQRATRRLREALH